MRVGTCAGDYVVEFDYSSMAKMELAGIRPLKILSEAGDSPDSMRVTDMAAMLDCCARPENGQAVPLMSALVDSGYGVGDILQIFTEVFSGSPFLTNRRLAPASSENASKAERNGSGEGT